METEMKVAGQTLNAQCEDWLVIEQFLMSNYRFRRNVLNGKVEFAKTEAEGKEPLEENFRPLTQEALNSIIIHAIRQNVLEKGNPKAPIEMYVRSEEVPEYNPIRQYLEHLPQWDGKNHVATLFNRLPGVSSEQASFLAIWLRSTVAHWLQMDLLHGNECVPVLIGEQGCGKTVFLRRLLPPQLQDYFLDHLNLSNKFDKEMALTNNLLVNLDEMDTITRSQQPSLKQTLSRNKVNGRPIYGTVQEDRKRFASFVASTNNRHPLQDATGSRRFICLEIPKGQRIDNDGDIDYEQLYAQVLYEIREEKAPYWFNNDEVARIQELNMEFMQQQDMAEMVKVCFRKPAEGETANPMNTTELLEVIQLTYPSVVINHKNRVLVGCAMQERGYEQTHPHNIAHYKAIPLKAA